jgi:uncharacterized RDD family membrane protein YckC
MVYDGVLLFGVSFAAGFAVLALSGWSTPLTDGRRFVLQATVFLAIGIYFCWCWSRSGQTLALKTWNLRVADDAGRNPTLRRCAARYVASWTLLAPGLLYVVLMQPSRAGSLAALAIGFVLMLLPAFFDRDRRLLHDRWTKTRVVRER